MPLWSCPPISPSFPTIKLGRVLGSFEGCLRRIMWVIPLSSCHHQAQFAPCVGVGMNVVFRLAMTGIPMVRGIGCATTIRTTIRTVQRKPKPMPKGKKGKTKKPVEAPEIPPPLCDFVEWIDKEMNEFHTSLIRHWREWKEKREERQRKRAAMEKDERERREERELRELARENREKEDRANDQARKVARAQHEKEAGPEAAKKGKYPWCTQ